MIFPTFEFIIFFIAFLAVWSFCKTSHSRIISLVGFNLFFYGFYSPVMLLYLLGWTFILYYFANKPQWVKFAIIFSIYQIFFWKMVDAKIWREGLMIPLGVSFFTFQGLTYLLGVLKTPSHLTQYHIDKPWGFFRVFAFVGFFPTIFSGPILRAKKWEKDLSTPIEQNNAVLHKAFILIGLGCLYKLCFSSLLHEYVQEAFSSPKDTGPLILLNGMYAYSLEIFHDFAGYSLMSMGIALLMGFGIPANFNSPYFSQNIKEFWQRWHISLSSWLRDYIYFFLGGSKVDKNRQLINVAIVMTLSGLWHGLSMNYLIWGLMHTIAIVFYHARSKHFKINKYLSCFILFNYISLAWIFFRSPSADIGFEYIWQMLHIFNFTLKDLNIPLYGLLIICLLIQRYEAKIISILENKKIIYHNIFTFVIFWLLIFVAILMISPAGMPPFIYFSY